MDNPPIAADHLGIDIVRLLAQIQLGTGEVHDPRYKQGRQQGAITIYFRPDMLALQYH